MRILLLVSLFGLSFLSSAQEDGMGGRLNVMECSENEVLAYVAKPNKARDVRSYEKFKPANIQTLIEEQNNSSDPVQCATLLYEDLGQMGDQLDNAMGFLTSGINPAESVMSQAWDYISKSVCDRVDAGLNTANDAIVSGIIRLENQLLSEIEDRVGQDALDEYVNDYIDDNTSGELGFEYSGAGNGVMVEGLQGNLKSKWKRKLRELNRELPNN
jgi:hypothetical protein